MQEFDVVIVGAGMAGASLAWALAPKRRVLLLEQESQPGYHSTGRSAATLHSSYGNATVRALTAASAPFYRAPPAGSDGTANWWKSYAFSDGFHPTPYGHDLLARRIMKSLADAGWY